MPAANPPARLGGGDRLLAPHVMTGEKPAGGLFANYLAGWAKTTRKDGANGRAVRHSTAMPPALAEDAGLHELPAFLRASDLVDNESAKDVLTIDVYTVTEADIYGNDVPVSHSVEIEGPRSISERSGGLAAVDPQTFTSTKIYFREIGQFKLLSAEDEIDLARKIELANESLERLRDELALSHTERLELDSAVTQGELARRQLAEANLRLVVSIARKYANRGVSALDLIQEGNIGLSRAIDKYDWRRGFRFSTYAYWWIRQAITRAINEQRSIRLPAHSTRFVGDIHKTVRELQQELCREPGVKEVAQRLGCTEERIKEALNSAQQPLSLDTPVAGDLSKSTFADLIADRTGPNVPDVAAQMMLEHQIQEAMRVLSIRERQVLSLRYGLSGTRPWRLSEIAHLLGVTNERARQIESGALLKLRREAPRNHLREYLDEDAAS
jgi:RNA polymerase primary sigma factor